METLQSKLKTRISISAGYMFFVLMALLQSFCAVSQIHKTPGTGKGVNVVVIIADDAGWNDVGYNGSEIKTPNIDLLASEGAKLQRFYVAPTCSPTRASLLIGMPSSRIGILTPIGGRSEKTLPDSIVTLPQALKKHGYQNALIGKWHLGLDIANGPNAFGFDYSYGFLHGQIDQYTHVYKNGDRSWYRNNQMIEEKGHATDLITNEAISWLTQKRDTAKNFYLQIAYSAPHYPLQEENKWKEPYLKTINNDSRRDFAAAMSHLDYAVGEILKTIKQTELDKNTLIIFMSDNGAQENWFPVDDYNLIHGPNSVLGSNKPLRDYKTSNYEGGIRVPAIMYSKNHIKPHQNNNYISVTDIMPTILKLAGVAVPKNVEGVDVWPSVLNANVETKHDIYVRGGKHESLIHKPWKIIRQRNNKGKSAIYHLFNIDLDPEEKIDLIDKEVAITSKMKILLESQFIKDEKTVNARSGE